MSGCATADNQATISPVQIISVSGSGSIAMIVYGQIISAKFSEDGIQTDEGLKHCTIIHKLHFNNLSFGSGYLPPPMSDERCSEKFNPFMFSIGSVNTKITEGE
jgi:hypothetical protein